MPDELRADHVRGCMHYSSPHLWDDVHWSEWPARRWQCVCGRLLRLQPQRRSLLESISWWNPKRLPTTLRKGSRSIPSALLVLISMRQSLHPSALPSSSPLVRACDLRVRVPSVLENKLLARLRSRFLWTRQVHLHGALPGTTNVRRTMRGSRPRLHALKQLAPWGRSTMVPVTTVEGAVPM